MQAGVPLLESVNASAVLADKAYDTDELRAWLECRGIKAGHPAKIESEMRTLNVIIGLIKEWHAVEYLFGKLKHYRRIAIRYEKKAINCMGMPSFSLVLLWLR